jgi:AAA domain-containing protein
MYATNLLQELPITRDVEATPPAPSDEEPLTERHDWLFVGYLRHSETKRNNPPLELRVTDLEELPRTVAAFVARDDQGHRYPYIFLAPALGRAFEEQATTALVAAAKRREPLWPAGVWQLEFDFTASDAARAETNRLAAVHSENHAVVLAADDKMMAVMHQQIDAAFAQAPAVRREVREEITDLLIYEVGLSVRNEYPLRRGTLEAIIASDFRTQVHARLYAAEQGAGGFQIVLIDPDHDWLRQHDLPSYRTPGGTRLRTDQEYRKLQERHVLPVAAERFVEFISDYHDDHNEDCEALPSKRRIAAWLKDEGICDPAPAAPIAPTAAALLAERGITETPHAIAVLPYLAWGGRLTLLAAREKDGKSTLVGGAVAALTSGSPWLGEMCAPSGPVLWLHEEAPDDVIGRLQKFGADLGRVHLLPLPHADAAQALTANTNRLRPGLVVVDSLVRYAAGRVTDPTRATQWEPIMSELLGLAQKSGAAILVLHHAGKKDGEYRDSTEIGASADMLIQMPGGLKGNRQRLEAKGRIIGVAPYENTVELVGTTHQLVANSHAGTPTGPTTAMAEQDSVVLDALIGTMSYTDWFKASGGRSKSGFNRTVKRLAGAIEKTKNGRYRRTRVVPLQGGTADGTGPVSGPADGPAVLRSGIPVGRPEGSHFSPTP